MQVLISTKSDFFYFVKPVGPYQSEVQSKTHWTTTLQPFSVVSS